MFNLYITYVKKTGLIITALMFVYYSKAQSPYWNWAINAQCSGNFEYGYGVKIGSTGDLFATGRFASDMVMGGVSPTSGSGTPIYAARLTNSGTVNWITKLYSSGGYDYTYALAIDNLDNTYIGLNSNSGAASGVVKCDGAGTVIWTALAPSSSSSGDGIAVDLSGNVYLTGYFSGTINFGSGNLLNSNSGSYDIYLAKYSSAGVIQWAVKAGGVGYDVGKGVVVGPTGNIYVIGGYTDAPTFGSITPPAAGTYSNLFIAKYSPSGTVLSVVTAENAGISVNNYWEQNEITIDPCENLYVTGHFMNTANFGGMTVTGAGGFDIFVAKCNTSGTWEWVERAGGSGIDEGFGIAIDNDLAVYITGFFQTTANFGSTSVITTANSAIFIAKYTTNETNDCSHPCSSVNLDWVQQSNGTIGEAHGNQIAVDNDRKAYITGFVIGTSTFGSTSLTSSGSADLYIASCSGPNIAPIVSGINNCDTIKMCGIGDTLILNPLFFSPENGQITTVTINSNGMQDITVLSNTPGNTVTPQIMVVSSIANTGNNVLTFTATDDGTPAGVTIVNVNIYVDPSASVTFFPVISGDLSICEGDSTLLSVSPTNYDTYQWNTGSTTTAIYADTAGHYWVTSSYNGCYKTKSVDVVQHAPPNAAIATNGYVCSGGSTTLTASGGGTYYWLNNNETSTSVTITPVIITTYTVQVQNIFGCQDTAQTTINVYPLPVADFTVNGVCKNNPANFTDISTFGGTITSWIWDFGDGSAQGTTQNPTHSYTDTGTYIVSLIISTPTGCSATKVEEVVIHPLPHAEFSAGSGCVGSLIPFVNQSSIVAPDVIQLWSWNFGDGSSINNNPNLTHQYSAIGQYNVKLVVVSDFGCRDSITHIATITPPLVINFSASDTIGCNPLCTTLQNLYSPPAGHTASYLWTFNDSIYDTTYSPYHCFVNNSHTLPESFSVSLTVMPDTGCVTTFTKTNYITVDPSPFADFAIEPQSTSVLFPTTYFSNYSQGGTSWHWNLGDSTINTDITPVSHTYSDTDTGHYTVTLLVTNNFGCMDTAVHIIEIYPDWTFYIPNSFTPFSSNRTNDKFQGYGFGFKEYEMTIFDRWGNLIYHTNDYNQPWDGIANNSKEKSEIDVYVYLFKINDMYNISHEFRGIVTLIR